MTTQDYILSKIGGAHISWNKSPSLSDLIYQAAKKAGK